jgi:hypothetical protein
VSAPKFRYIIVTPENDVLGTNDVERARDFGDNDETFVIDTVLGKYSFDGDEQEVEARP